jgi:hypothetical protein
MAVKQINDNIAILEDAQAIAIRVPESYDYRKDVGQLRNITYGKGKNKKSAKIKYWGVDNRQPSAREILITENNIVPELIGTKRDITIGGSLMAYKSRYEEGKEKREFVETPAEAQDFFDKINLNKYLMCACKNLFLHANVFTEFVSNKGGDQIASIEAKECRHIRAEEMDLSGRINNYYWNGNWEPLKNEERDWPTYQIPAYMPKKDELQSKFIYHTGDDLLTDDYYYIPRWWGGKNWIELSNCIPTFHMNNLKHGYTIRYHIQIPKDYFRDNTSPQQTPDQRKAAISKENEAKQAFLSKLNKFLAGLTNTGRAIITDYEINRAVGKEFPGIKITPLEVDLQDEALLKLFEKSNQANISAQGIHPTLANIETQGKLSSGSEIRNAFLMYVAIKTPLPRRILLEPIYMVHKINGWDPTIKWTFKDIEIKTLDEDKTGTSEVNVQ